MGKSARIDESTDGQGEIRDGQTGSGSASLKTKSATRRNLLQMGAGLAAVTGLSRGLVGPAIARDPVNMPKAPNIIVLMTDQERHHRHWPDGWTEKNLPSLQRLKRPWSLLPTRLYGRMSMLAVARADADGPLCAGEPRNPDLSVAWPGAQGPPAEHRLTAQGESRLRGGLER